jgi:hypothetical protein
MAAVLTCTLAACGGDGNSGGGGGGSNGPQLAVFAGTPGPGANVDGPLIAAQFNAPAGLATDNLGNIYVADNQNFTIRKITGATVTTVAGVPGQPGNDDGPAGSATFSGPSGIRVDSSGNVYVTDETPVGNPLVRRIGTDGTVQTLTDSTGAPLRTNGSFGIGIDGQANVYVFTTDAATGANALAQITASGVETEIPLQDATGAPVTLVNPQDVVVDAANQLYVADDNIDGSGGLIFRVSVSGGVGVATPLAGSRTAAGFSDGQGANASFDGLASLAIAPSGTLYANDFNNGTVRMITSDGVVSTVVGTVGLVGLQTGPLPGVLPDITGMAWLNQSLYMGDLDDNVVLQAGPLP